MSLKDLLSKKSNAAKLEKKENLQANFEKRVIKNKVNKTEKYNFFGVITQISFAVTIGSFVAAFVLFLTLNLFQPSIALSNLSYFAALGVLVFVVCGLIFYFLNVKKLKRHD